jgi:hypothetical protein
MTKICYSCYALFHILLLKITCWTLHRIYPMDFPISQTANINCWFNDGYSWFAGTSLPLKPSAMIFATLHCERCGCRSIGNHLNLPCLKTHMGQDLRTENVSKPYQIDHFLTNQLSQLSQLSQSSTIPFYILYIFLPFYSNFTIVLQKIDPCLLPIPGCQTMPARPLSSEPLACLQSLRPVTLPALHVLPLVEGLLLSEGDVALGSVGTFCILCR